MTTDELSIIEKKIDALIKEKEEHNFTTLRKKVEDILKDVHLFKIEDQLNTKAVDLYLKNVITQRNNIKKEQEEKKLDNSQKTKYILIEEICKKLDFKTKAELIEKVKELEKKTNLELNELNKRS